MVLKVQDYWYSERSLLNKQILRPEPRKPDHVVWGEFTSLITTTGSSEEVALCDGFIYAPQKGMLKS